MYFECHYIDAEDDEGRGGRRRRPQVQKINGKWLIANSAGVDRACSAGSGRRDGATRSARSAAPLGEGGRRSRGMKNASSAGRPRAREVAHEAARRVPRIAALLVLVGVLGLRSSASRTRASTPRHAAAAVGHATRRSRRTPNDLQQLLAFGRGHARRSRRTPAAKSAPGRRRVAARRPGDRQHALAARAGRHRGALRLRPAAQSTSAELSGSGATIARSGARSRRLRTLDRRGVRGYEGAARPSRPRASTGDTTSRRPRRRLALRTTDRDAVARSPRTGARTRRRANLFIAVSAASVVLALRSGSSCPGR